MRCVARTLTTVELGTDTIAQKDRDAAAALLVESHLEGLRDHVLPRAVETSEAEDEALLGAGRVALTEGLDNGASRICQTEYSKQFGKIHLLVAEPVRDGRTSLQAPPQLSTGDVESLNTLGDFVDGLILVG